jgi:hypothetical protein
MTTETLAGVNAAAELARYKAAVTRALELLESAPEAFIPTTSNNLRAAASVLREAHDTPGVTA